MQVIYTFYIIYMYLKNDFNVVLFIVYNVVLIYFVFTTLLILSFERRNHSLNASSNSADIEPGNRFITESEICTIKIVLIKIKI